MGSLESVRNEIEKIRNEFLRALQNTTDFARLEEIRLIFLSRKGAVAGIMDVLKSLSLEEKKVLGPLANSLKQETQEAFNIKLTELEKKAALHELQKQQTFDVTAYTPHTPRGSLHPLTQFVMHVERCAINMGFAIAQGPEVETEYYNFEALNIPADHPARDMWDTFWLDVPSLLLRTHTSSVQIHAMQSKQPPMAFVAPGRCYRHEATDASHDFMFMQLEGLVIDTTISMSNLLATVKLFMEAIFEKKSLEIRVRPSYFPFVEPGIEIDMQCPFCNNGCSTCKQTRWIEICGAGLIHPRVLKQCNIDSKTYAGFAFGFGLTRLAMLKYKIDDIRLIHSGSIHFLSQF